jgi:phenylalanyl-tRNA synthetase beta subunit
MTNGTIKIMKPVMQEVEVSRQELLNTLLKNKNGNSKFRVQDLVTANIADTGQGYGEIKGIAVVTQVNPKRKNHPLTGHTLDTAENWYSINYFDCNNCVKTYLYASDSDLTPLE